MSNMCASCTLLPAVPTCIISNVWCTCIYIVQYMSEYESAISNMHIHVTVHLVYDSNCKHLLEGG